MMTLYLRPNEGRRFLEAMDVTIDREFRWEYALEMSDNIRNKTGTLWEPVDHRCRDCGNFMHVLRTNASETIETIACWDCALNNECANTARALRVRLKMQVSGIEFGRDHTNYWEGAPL